MLGTTQVESSAILLGKKCFSIRGQINLLALHIDHQSSIIQFPVGSVVTDRHLQN
jgi:hypothetical protein